MRRVLSLAFALCACMFFARSSEAGLINFVDGTYVDGQNWTNGTFTLQITSGHSFSPNLGGFSVSPDGTPIVMALSVVGGSFDLNSVIGNPATGTTVFGISSSFPFTAGPDSLINGTTNLTGYTNLLAVTFVTDPGMPLGLSGFDANYFPPPSAVPEPTSLALAGVLGGLGALRYIRRRKTKQLEAKFEA